MLRRLFATTGLTIFLGLFAISSAEAATPVSITYRHDHFLYTIPARDIATWQRPHEAWLYNGRPFAVPQELRAEGETDIALPTGLQKVPETGWDKNAIKHTLREKVATHFDRAAGSVVISRTQSGTYAFEGVGLTGRKVDLDAAAELTIEALEKGITEIGIPFGETQPSVTVNDPELKKLGIKEVVTVGESEFGGSPKNRRHNIAVGLSKFNGHLIPQGEVFSFNKVLGNVDGAAGYLRELVIKGDRTEPDYGGGLCQISSTAYRGVWEYGFPIVDRRNHSYAVSYYFPPGTDATVYLPNPDMKFENDSPGALLIQTHAENDKAYFIYYGTRDARTSEVVGPFIWGRQSPPPDKTVYTTDLAPGTRQKLGERHAGMRAAWVRVRTDLTGAIMQEPVISIYQARPLFYQVGVETLPPTDGSGAIILDPTI